jgi:ketosteroid isomerase-like protein
VSPNDALLAERYYAAWNARDLDAILALYADDIEFSSPYIAALGFAPDGVIHGKQLLRLYFEKALERAPGLTFTPESLCVGARGHTLIYRNHRGERAAEHHQIDAMGLIVRAEATYETH